MKHDRNGGTVRRPIRTGFRGRALLILGVLDLVYATGLAMAAFGIDGNVTTDFVSRAVPPGTLALLWLTVSVLCFTYAFRENDSIAWSAAMSVKVFWGILSGVGWLLNEIPRGYIGLAIWLAFASLVWLISRWPEPSKSINPFDPEGDL